MSTNTQSTIDYLNYVTRQLNHYIPLALLALGSIGNFTNILVFSRPLLRRNPCSIYFISSSIVNFFALYVGLITPFLGYYNLDPTQYIDILCKIRFYLRLSSITLSTWFILLACIDRYVSSSENVNLRLWSSLTIAKRTVLISSVICFLLPYSQIFYCYAVNSKHVCSLQNNTCQLLNNIIALLLNSFVPPILMVVFSILTIRNVNYRNHLHTNRNYSRRDAQLTRILLIQVSIVVLFAIPVAIQKLYTVFTLFMTKSALTTAIESLANQISIEILYISNSTTFYVYSITSKKYRKEVVQILSVVLKCHRGNDLNQVQPIATFRGNSRVTQAKTVNTLHSSNIRNRDSVL